MGKYKHTTKKQSTKSSEGRKAEEDTSEIMVIQTTKGNTGGCMHVSMYVTYVWMYKW